MSPGVHNLVTKCRGYGPCIIWLPFWRFYRDDLRCQEYLRSASRESLETLHVIVDHQQFQYFNSILFYFIIYFWGWNLTATLHVSRLTSPRNHRHHLFPCLIFQIPAFSGSRSDPPPSMTAFGSNAVSKPPIPGSRLPLSRTGFMGELCPSVSIADIEIMEDQVGRSTTFNPGSLRLSPAFTMSEARS